MSDLISRQAALDSLGVTKNATKYGGDHSGYDTRMLYEIHDALTGIPAADPEIIRCKDCKWLEDADGSMCKNPASWVVATDRDFGCVLAERRNDE